MSGEQPKTSREGCNEEDVYFQIDDDSSETTFQNLGKKVEFDPDRAMRLRESAKVEEPSHIIDQSIYAAAEESFGAVDQPNDFRPHEDNNFTQTERAGDMNRSEFDHELSKEYRAYAETLLNRSDELSEAERQELPDGWQEKMQEIAAQENETDGFVIRDTYREIYNAWEDNAMCNEILRDPEHRGIGEIKVIDARHNMTVDEIYATIDAKSRSRYTKEYIEQCLTTENDQHRAELTQFLDAFDGQLKQGRVCPVPEYSPFALYSCKKMDGTIHIDTEFVRDVEQMREYGLKDINLVASLASRGEDGLVTLELPDVDKYCTMIESLVKQIGDEGLTITLGNETNETIINNSNGEDVANNSVMISQEIPPDEYGHFFREAAQRLKTQFPNLKLCLAGTSFLAPNYTSRVLEAIYREGDEERLVDRIDFHPYRAYPNEPVVSQTDYKYGDDDISKREGWTYDDYENELLDIARKYQAELIVGEVQFGGGEDPVATVASHRKIEEALTNSAKKGIKSNIWPRVGLPF